MNYQLVLFTQFESKRAGHLGRLVASKYHFATLESLGLADQA